MKKEVREAADELGLTPEEFERRKGVWLAKLKASNKLLKSRLTSFIGETSGFQPNQKDLRMLSWTYSAQLRDMSFVIAVDRVLKGLPFPLPIGNSTQDTYHLTHFVNAFLLCLFRPDFKLVTQEYSIAAKLFEVEKDESARAEGLQALYSHLVSFLPTLQEKSGHTESGDIQSAAGSLSKRIDNLEARVKKLEKCLQNESQPKSKRK